MGISFNNKFNSFFYFFKRLKIFITLNFNFFKGLEKTKDLLIVLNPTLVYQLSILRQMSE